jgi:hypothetical protein
MYIYILDRFWYIPLLPAFAGLPRAGLASLGCFQSQDTLQFMQLKCERVRNRDNTDQSLVRISPRGKHNGPRYLRADVASGS